MAKEVIIRIKDDLDGSPANETLTFAVRGTSYEIDLSNANVELFEKSVQQFIEAAREIHSPSPQGPPTKSRLSSRELKQQRRMIRVWASHNGWPGLDEATKGRIPYEAIEAYQLTHPEVELPLEIVPSRRGPRRYSGADSVSSQEMLALSTNGEVNVTDLMDDEPEVYQTKGAATAAANRRKRFGSKLDKLTKEDRDHIRVWAKANGFRVIGTGMIPADVLDAYFASEENK